MRFQFELRPVAQVAPWGGDRPRLHWFGLTDGWYWINAEGHDFPRYRDQAVRRWELVRPYPDYYIARLWEDLIVLRWVLTTPVPEDLILFIDGTFRPREFPDAVGAEAEAAFEFQGDHVLDLGYLTHAPDLICWRHSVEGRDVVTLVQRIAPDGRGTFAGSPQLEISVPVAVFFAAVEDFDRRLISAMQKRVAELEHTGPPPGVELDLTQLRREQSQRSHWLERRLAESRTIDWAEVRSGVAEISSWLPLRLDDSL